MYGKRSERFRLHFEARILIEVLIEAYIGRVIFSGKCIKGEIKWTS